MPTTPLPTVDDLTSPVWFQEQLKGETRTISNATLESMADAGGLSADMQRVVVQFTDGTTDSFVLKMTPAAARERSKELDLTREAEFFNNYATLLLTTTTDSGKKSKSSSNVNAELLLGPLLPRVLYAGCSVQQGTKVILMENLANTGAVQSGYFFGPGSVLNWGKDLNALTLGFNTDVLTVETIAKMAFTAAAKVHASYWANDALCDVSWLRGSGWLAGRDRESWEASQRHISECWAQAKEKMSNDKEGLQWDPAVIACVEASVSRVAPGANGWEAFQAELKSRPPFTLVHGDFHPGNMMVRKRSDTKKGDEYELVLLDWEVVGAGSGPQDLGQYMISHTEPTLRAKIERSAVETYYSELTLLNPSVAPTMSFEACWEEYINGGLGRWMWMLPILAVMLPPKPVQYFHDQVKDFITTHSITPGIVPLPRA